MNVSQFTAATAKVIHAVQTGQSRYGLFPTDGKKPCAVVVGVSGGADSVCLLHVLAHMATTLHLELHVAHLDHGLRSNSAADAELVRDLAAALRLPFHAEVLRPGTLAAHGGGLEDAARQARYAFLCQVAHCVTPETCAPTVAVAHHADDQAETVLMHLIGGSGLSGLGGMRWTSLIDETRFTLEDGKFSCHSTDEDRRPVRLVRPFLALDRQNLRDYLKESGWTWHEDPTNWDTTRLRNRIRHVILPLLTESNPNITATLGRTAQVLAAEADRSTSLDEVHFRHLLVEDTPARRLVLDLTAWRILHLAEQRGVLRLALERWGVDLRATGFDHVESLVWLLRSESTTGGPFFLLGRLFWSIAPSDGPDQPARLSLHDKDVLPFQPRHPLLPQSWTQPQTVPVPGRLRVNGWQLRTELVPPVDVHAKLGNRQERWRAFLDTTHIDELAVRPPRLGDKFSPLGLNGHSKQLGDFFTDRKVPPVYRSKWPLVVDTASGRILWVSGLEIDHTVRITASTQSAIHLFWEKHQCQELRQDRRSSDESLHNQ